MSEKPKGLLITTEKVYKGFFNEKIIAQIQSLVDLKIITRKCFGDEFNYREILKAYSPRIIITGWESPYLTCELHKMCGELKLIIHTAGSVKGIVEKGVLQKGVLVSNWGSTSAITIAEASLMRAIASLRRVPFWHNEMHFRGNWKGPDAYWESLFYKKVGIHGFGKISKALVKLLAPFSCEISAYSPHAPEESFIEYNIKRSRTLKDLYSENQIIVNLAAATEENYHIVDENILKSMPDHSHLILTGRGMTMDTEALIRELRSGRIYAALDVFEQEPLSPKSPLRGLDNCLLIPHMAGPTPDRYVDMGNVALQNIKNFLGKQALINEVTADKYSYMT